MIITREWKIAHEPRSLTYLHVQLGQGKQGGGIFWIMLEGLFVQLDGTLKVPLIRCMFCHLCTHAEGGDGRNVLLQRKDFLYVKEYYAYGLICQ